MAEQPRFFDIEDYETGKRYRVEAYADDVTYDEADPIWSIPRINSKLKPVLDLNLSKASVFPLRRSVML